MSNINTKLTVKIVVAILVAVIMASLGGKYYAAFFSIVAIQILDEAIHIREAVEDKE